MKIFIEPPSSQNLIISRNFQYWFNSWFIIKNQEYVYTKQRRACVLSIKITIKAACSMNHKGSPKQKNRLLIAGKFLLSAHVFSVLVTLQ